MTKPPQIFPELEGRADAAEATADAFLALGPEFGMINRLTAVGISHNHLPMMAEDSMKQERLLENNPREMTREAALGIYQAAL